jgi:hypothetical protein
MTRALIRRSAAGGADRSPSERDYVSAVPQTHFHQINRKTGNRLRQQMVDEETGRVVDKDNKGRGYELTKGKYIEIVRSPNDEYGRKHGRVRWQSSTG